MQAADAAHLLHPFTDQGLARKGARIITAPANIYLLGTAKVATRSWTP